MRFGKRGCFLVSVFLLIYSSGFGCGITVTGQVYDETSGLPLAYVTVYIQETSVGTVTDDDGKFELSQFCFGEYHLVFSHIGCATKRIHLTLKNDTTIRVALPHTATSLGSVMIEGTKDEAAGQPHVSLNRQKIEDNANQNLASLLEDETGVYLIKNGKGIAKPVVHGLYGVRLNILNNGIAQSGQQWGNDHSPEIDAFSADQIVVIKGASAIEYAGGSLGSVILVQPSKIGKEPHLHGQANYTFETNGRGHSLNARLEQYAKALGWRLSGTLKRYGDQQAADYFLNNTGMAEASLALQLEKSLRNKVFFEGYASTFNTRLGILRGSHIGNLTDLEAALNQEQPFFTESTFSYDIDAPRQHVSHHLVKAKAKYYPSEKQSLIFVAAIQQNNRKEFDVRRSGREDIPALSLSQFSTNAELSFTQDFGSKWRVKFGSQNRIKDNSNDPETGILPLIPDYVEWQSGVYAKVAFSHNKTDFDVGLRYDYEQQKVTTISRSLPRKIIRYHNQKHNLSSLLSVKFDLGQSQAVSLNAGYGMRNPAINELYSSGLHQGVSGIEEGNLSLKTESAVKGSVAYKWFPDARFSFSSVAYYQHFKDYIYLNPQDEIRLTIRGAFPVFQYEQTNARIYGLDLSTQFTMSNFLFGVLKYSYLRGDDLSLNQPLIFMPPNRLFGSLQYRFKQSSSLGKHLLLEETEIEVNSKLVLEQKHYNEGQDFVAPPSKYLLLGLKLSTNLLFSTQKLRIFIDANNLLNTGYRDYLNRHRYFADDLGISLSFGLAYKF